MGLNPHNSEKFEQLVPFGYEKKTEILLVKNLLNSPYRRSNKIKWYV